MDVREQIEKIVERTLCVQKDELCWHLPLENIADSLDRLQLKWGIEERVDVKGCGDAFLDPRLTIDEACDIAELDVLNEWVLQLRW